MHRSRFPFLPAFGIVSVALHAVGLGTLCRPVSTEAPFAAHVSPLTGDTVEIEGITPSETANWPVATAGKDTPAGVDHALAEPETSHPSVLASDPRASFARSPHQSTKPVSTALALFGAVGERSALDLIATFVRAFPQAASADPVWSSASLGGGGANVVLVLDDTGHLKSFTIAGSPGPGSTTPPAADVALGSTTPPAADVPSALRRGIDRTLGILGGRLFTSRGAVTRLRVAVRLSRDELHDGLHGDVFALSGGSFSGDVGSAFFALPSTSGPGRRVDVDFRILR